MVQRLLERVSPTYKVPEHILNEAKRRLLIEAAFTERLDNVLLQNLGLLSLDEINITNILFSDAANEEEEEEEEDLERDDTKEEEEDDDAAEPANRDDLRIPMPPDVFAKVNISKETAAQIARVFKQIQQDSNWYNYSDFDDDSLGKRVHARLTHMRKIHISLLVWITSNEQLDDKFPSANKKRSNLIKNLRKLVSEIILHYVMLQLLGYGIRSDDPLEWRYQLLRIYHQTSQVDNDESFLQQALGLVESHPGRAQRAVATVNTWLFIPLMIALKGYASYGLNLFAFNAAVITIVNTFMDMDLSDPNHQVNNVPIAVLIPGIIFSAYNLIDTLGTRGVKIRDALRNIEDFGFRRHDHASDYRYFFLKPPLALARKLPTWGRFTVSTSALIAFGGVWFDAFTGSVGFITTMNLLLFLAHRKLLSEDHEFAVKIGAMIACAISALAFNYRPILPNTSTVIRMLRDPAISLGDKLFACFKGLGAAVGQVLMYFPAIMLGAKTPADKVRAIVTAMSKTFMQAGGQISNLMKENIPTDHLGANGGPKNQESRAWDWRPWNVSSILRSSGLINCFANVFLITYGNALGVFFQILSWKTGKDGPMYEEYSVFQELVYETTFAILAALFTSISCEMIYHFAEVPFFKIADNLRQKQLAIWEKLKSIRSRCGLGGEEEERRPLSPSSPQPETRAPADELQRLWKDIQNLHKGFQKLKEAGIEAPKATDPPARSPTCPSLTSCCGFGK